MHKQRRGKTTNQKNKMEKVLLPNFPLSVLIESNPKKREQLLNAIQFDESRALRLARVNQWTI